MYQETKLTLQAAQPRRVLTLLFLTVPLVCLGCSRGGDDIKLAPVSGVVTMDGKPLTNAIVIFSPQKGNPSSGRTDSSGNYTLTYRDQLKGAVPGSHSITIITAPPESPRQAEDSEVAEVIPVDTFASSDQGVPKLKLPKDTFKKDPIPERYNSKSELKKEVVEGKNKFDFELQSK
ncbi:MAG: Ig-like domain-containing protein [bacterium]|nr:Ig-like domain-containing protein [bacterium]